MNNSNIEFSLSLDNAKGMPLDRYEKDFVFIVDDKPYETSRYIADLLSPIIRQYHFIDETANSYIIHSKKVDLEEGESLSSANDYFPEFLKLAEFNQTTINEAQRNHYIDYFIQLGNIDEYLRLQPEIKDTENPDEAIDNIKLIIENITHLKYMDGIGIEKITNDLNINKLIKIVSSHFSQISKDKIKQLPLEIIERFLNEETLKIDDEDSLLNLIIELYTEDDKYSKLFEYVKFCNVSEETMSNFIERFDIDDLSSGIWQSICKRLLTSSQKVQLKERYNENYNYKEFKHDSSNEFHGIMRYLTDKTNGNIHDNGTIVITSNSIHSDGYHPKYLVDYANKSTIYHSKHDVENATICFDFKDKSVQLTSYTVQSYNGNKTSGHLKNWVVEVSNDNNDWKVIDKHVDDPTLQTPDKIATFNTEKTQEFYRFVRIHQTGNSWYGNYFLYFPFVEFYGKIKEPDNSEKSPK